CDVVEGGALVGHEIVENRLHTADHAATGEEVGCDRQVTVVGDSTRDLAVRFAQSERVGDDDDARPGSFSSRNLQYCVDVSVGCLNVDVGHGVPIYPSNESSHYRSSGVVFSPG